MSIESKKQKKKLASMGQVVRAYWDVLVRHTSLMAGVVFFSLVVQGTELAAPLYLRKFFNLLAVSTPSETIVHSLVITLGFVALFWFVDLVAQRIQGIFNEVLEARVMAKLFERAFHYTLGHSYNFFISNFAGALTHKVSRFSRSFETLFDAIVTQFFPTLIFVLGAIVILFLHNTILGLILAVWTVCFIIFQVVLSRLRQPMRQERAEAEAGVTAALADSISNQNTIALFSGTLFEQKRFGENVKIWAKATLRSWLSDGWTQSALSFFMVAIQVVLLYGAVKYWQQGLVTLGDFILIQSYLMITFGRLMGINWQLRRFYDAFADASEFVAILKTPHEIQDIPNAATLTVSKGNIGFKNIQFGFNERTVLDNLSLEVKAYEKIALVGPSGAGKSTITKLLLRLYDVQSGEIVIDGQNIANVTQDSLRDAIAFVPQEPILFHRTLMENIRYGRRDATDEEVIEAAKKAHCHEFISGLPEQYKTYVGERGIRLSGGERQRVAIARAILKNAPILVLDEATSSLDSESEALIQDALEILMRDKTVLVIAHRLSTIMKMDRIVVLEKGKVVAEGTHQELLDQGGLYQKLWSIQAGGFLPDDQEKGLAIEEIVELEKTGEGDIKIASNS